MKCTKADYCKLKATNLGEKLSRISKLKTLLSVAH